MKTLTTGCAKLAMWAVTESLQLKTDAGGGDGGWRRGSKPSNSAHPHKLAMSKYTHQNPSAVHSTESRGHQILSYWSSYL